MATEVSTAIEWSRSGTTFSVRSTADQTSLLPPGIYNFAANNSGWWLDRIADKFEFPFKVYGCNDNILKRISTYWKNNGNNLGVLLNGLRGGGKTMAAQQLANKLIEEIKIPVLIVRNPIPLHLIYENVRQDLMVIFDEFEKTHDKDQQQALLSTIDGMNRSKHKRLNVFTTNVVDIDPNFKDRPSRIHYQFEFSKLADEIIEGLINDGLPPELMHFKADIFDYVQTREICTIDIVKAVITEVRTFKESPREFEDLLNISKGEPPSFTIKIVDPKTNTPLEIVYDFFRLDGALNGYSSLLCGNKRALEEFADGQKSTEIYYGNYDGYYYITLLEKCPEENLWLANVSLPLSKTFYKEFDHLKAYSNARLYIDKKPEKWKFNFTNDSVKDPKEREKLNEIFNNSNYSHTLHGSREREVLKISIVANKEKKLPPSRYKAGDYAAHPPHHINYESAVIDTDEDEDADTDD